MEDFPVYLFTGFLESGKTRFIKETLEDPRFNGGERTLLLLCEEGEVEYDTDLRCMENVFIEVIENESDLTPRVLDYLEKKHRAERVMVEYNGMWMLSSLYDNMPDAWAIYQEFLFIDAGTFLSYNANMRGLVVDKLTTCELAVFNRFVAGMSMGGYGAYKLGITCADKFCAIGGIAGSYHAQYRYQGKVNTVSTLCEALYGNPPAMTPEIHDIFTMMKNRKENGVELPRMYTCCGTEDRRYQDSVDLKEFADEFGIPLVFENGPGKHDAVFFDEYIQKILDWMGFVGGPVE